MKKKGNRQHASREKTLFSWSVCSMQAGRGFAKPFAKLLNMRGEGGFLPSCHILPNCLLNCWMVVLSVFAKKSKMPTPFAKLLEMLSFGFHFAFSPKYGK